MKVSGAKKANNICQNSNSTGLTFSLLSWASTTVGKKYVKIVSNMYFIVVSTIYIF